MVPLISTGYNPVVLFGTAYEVIAADYLKKQGVRILEMNYRTSRGEIDIIGKEKDTICFIEVKYRNSTRYGTPQEASAKIHHTLPALS